jgi:hypothetical protein
LTPDHPDRANKGGGTMVRSVADRKRYADLLAEVPNFEGCSRTELEQFLAEHASEVSCPAGGLVSQELRNERRLIVVIEGTATMVAPDGIETALEPGDYFGGRYPAERIAPGIVVTARSEVHALVIGPQAFCALPSRSGSHSVLRTTTRFRARRQHRREVLVGLAEREFAASGH